MREIVIIPAWRRPDFLAATLQRLAIADEGTQEFWISLDRGHSAPVARVATDWLRRLSPKRGHLKKRTHVYRGNSMNVLSGYAEAVKAGADVVHLVEEDVFVGTDYFAAHRAAHALAPEVMAVSLARNQNFPDDPAPDPEALYLNGQYQSVAVSFRAAALRPVLEHITPAYLANPIAYCRQHFPRSRIPIANAEQDGLIHRVIEAAGGRVAYAARPRAYHAGFVGYHRAGQPALTPGICVTAAAQSLLAMDSAELNRRAHSYPDHYAVDLDATLPPLTRVIRWPV